MDIQDIKLYAINLATMAITMTQIEMFLKITLLLVSIGYTLTKWYEVHNRNNK
jgi:hypothetical protein